MRAVSLGTAQSDRAGLEGREAQSHNEHHTQARDGAKLTRAAGWGRSTRAGRNQEEKRQKRCKAEVWFGFLAMASRQVATRSSTRGSPGPARTLGQV